MKNRTQIFTLLLIGSFYLNAAYCQVKSKPVTKLFFESGFDNCRVKVTDNGRTLFQETLRSIPSDESGALKIVEIYKIKANKIRVSACGRTKTFRISSSKFYRISLLENVIKVIEVEYEPLYG